MPKLIFINRYFHPDTSATSELLSDLAFEIAKQSSNVHVITSRQLYSNPAAKLVKQESVNGVHTHRVWTSQFGRLNLLGRTLDYLTFYLSATVKLWWLARRNDVIVVKTDPPLISVPAAVVAHSRDALLVNWIQDMFPEIAAALNYKITRNPAYRLLRRARNFSLSSARMNIVLGDLMAERLRVEGVDSKSIKVLHNWADEKRLTPVPEVENELRILWGLRKEFVIGYCGNMGRVHEFDTLLASGEMLKYHQGISFLLVGDGAQLEYLRREIDKRSLENFVLRPYQPKEMLTQTLSVPDVHIISLRPELEGLVVPSKFYSVQAVGRPAIYIGAKDGEVARMIDRYQCGVVIEPSDSNGLTLAIRTLANNEALCKKFGQNARASVERTHTRMMAISDWMFTLDMLRVPSEGTPALSDSVISGYGTTKERKTQA